MVDESNFGSCGILNIDKPYAFALAPELSFRYGMKHK